MMYYSSNPSCWRPVRKGRWTKSNRVIVAPLLPRRHERKGSRQGPTLSWGAQSPHALVPRTVSLGLCSRITSPRTSPDTLLYHFPSSLRHSTSLWIFPAVLTYPQVTLLTLSSSCPTHPSPPLQSQISWRSCLHSSPLLSYSLFCSSFLGVETHLAGSGGLRLPSEAVCKSRETTVKHSSSRRNLEWGLHVHQDQILLVSPSLPSFLLSLCLSLDISSFLPLSLLLIQHYPIMTTPAPGSLSVFGSHCQQTDAQERWDLISLVISSIEETSHRSLASYYRIQLF